MLHNRKHIFDKYTSTFAGIVSNSQYCYYLSNGQVFFSGDDCVPEMLMRVVSILPPLGGIKLSMKVGPPVRLILDKLTFTNSRLMLRESFLPVTEVDSSSTVPSGGGGDIGDGISWHVIVLHQSCLQEVHLLVDKMQSCIFNR